LHLSSNPSVPGQAVTYTIVVAARSGKPSGSVRLTGLPGKALTLTLHGGVATFTVAPPLGRFVVQASYLGSADFLASAAVRMTQTVETLALEPDPRHKGKSLLVVGATAGMDRISVTKHGKEVLVTLSQVSGGHTRAHASFAASALTEVLVYGTKKLDPVQVSGLKLPVAYAKPAAPVKKTAQLSLAAVDAALAEWGR
jgi:hypothetical protein